ncbi:MAG: hypothetical protein J6M62_04560 [Selenomonadaceae bacterium]|nr:hypothetical protein [Selenomonadaceae bacterium]MBP3721738.1 hypothetical protein [Selenomonadaceae bacterium]MBR3721266.1 hypothetical protein [Selenomonadaceae bacterium]
MAKNQTQKVTVRLYVPNGRQTIHGFPLTKPINVYRQIRKDKDGLPFIQYAGKQIYIRPAHYLYDCYEECERDKAWV